MSRFNTVDSLIMGAAAALLAMPSVVMADVLEVGTDSAVWVAGGTIAAASFSATPAADAAGIAPNSSTHLAAITDVADTAGPAQWRGRVAELATKYDISPALLEALVWQESRWHTGAVSPVGARGLAQLMPGTARQLGVNPHDPSANLEGGARYLRAQLDTFDGDIEKALAAYNAGPGRVLRAGGIPRIRETQNYVSAILSRLSQPVRR